MTHLFLNRKRLLGATLILVVFVMGQGLSASIINTISINSNNFNFSNEDLLRQIEMSTTAITTLYNNEEGIFLWNVQNPENLSRYGDLADISNREESLDFLDYKHLLDACAQDVALQYLLLKNYVSISLQYMGDIQSYYDFNRDWIYSTAKIVEWVDQSIASSDTLIGYLDILSNEAYSFDEYWNILVRPRYNSLVDEKISLLGETIVLGSKILRAVEFMPYFSNYEKISFLSMAERASDWWLAINAYALYDPDFAIAGIGKSRISTEYESWIGWSEFKQMAYREEFTPTDITTLDHLEFQKYLFTSPQLANQYLTYIEKVSTKESYMWDSEQVSKTQIENSNLLEIYNQVIKIYAEHITRVRNKVVYVFNPDYNISWSALPYRFSGYTYQLDDYFVDQQGDEIDLYEYRLDNSPLTITGFRTYQGAGDIRGLMDIYEVLSHDFITIYPISNVEIASMNVLTQIIKSQREDNGFVFSPYFGTALDASIVEYPLFNDAKLHYPIMLPEGLDIFTGSITVFDFLLNAKQDLELFSHHSELSSLKSLIDKTIYSLSDLVIENIDLDTQGISKQSIVGNNLDYSLGSQIYCVMDIVIEVDLSGNDLMEEDLPNWLINYNQETEKAQSLVQQWKYLKCLFSAFAIYQDTKFIEPIFTTFILFNQDFQEDEQYQLLSICEVKDAVARNFFIEELIDTNIGLNDLTGLYGSSIPYSYRSEVFPVTRAFAAETPQQVSAMVLSILPILENLFEILSNPINQIVISGFVTGLILTISVVYIRRPKNQ